MEKCTIVVLLRKKGLPDDAIRIVLRHVCSDVPADPLICWRTRWHTPVPLRTDGLLITDGMYLMCDRFVIGYTDGKHKVVLKQECGGHKGMLACMNAALQVGTRAVPSLTTRRTLMIQSQEFYVFEPAFDAPFTS